MTDSPLHIAKRELHGFFNTRPAWIATLAAGILLGVAGPFGTDEVMRVLPRGLYWVAIAFVSYLTGSVIDAVLRPPLTRAVSLWVALPLTACVSAIAITVEIVGLNALLFGFFPSQMGLAILAGNVFIASLVIATALNLIGEAETATTAEQPPALLARLPLEKRGKLISLSAVDHYVEVTTTKGTELILMRLADAITEAAPTPGLHLHRSHWAATGEIAAVKKLSGKAEVTLSDGRTLPVSRTNLPALKDSGLLPA